MDNIPIITFSYLTPMEIDKLNAFMMVAKSTILMDGIIDHYCLSRITEDPFISNCISLEVLLNDIMAYPSDHKARKAYDNLINNYPMDSIKIFIHNDRVKIMNKISDTFLFALDKIYKCDELQVQFEKYKVIDDEKDKSSIISLLYEAAQENFMIIDQDMTCQKCFINIKKRRNENGNDAN